MKLDLTQPLQKEPWMKEELNDNIASIIKKYVYIGHGIEQNADEKKFADMKYSYYKLFMKLDSATDETEYTPEELVIIKRVAALCLAPGLYGKVVDLIDGGK